MRTAPLERPAQGGHDAGMGSPLVPAVVLAVGLVLYLVPSSGKLNEIGRILFFVGTLWLVDLFAHARLHIG